MHSYSHYIMLFAFLFSGTVLYSQNSEIVKKTTEYCKRDTISLELDYYTINSNTFNKSCIIYVHGGSFKSGERDSKVIEDFANKMVDSTLCFVSISYRLDMRDKKGWFIFQKKALNNALKIAVEDLISSTRWVIQSSSKLKIDTNKIILMGSSAGALTVLRADYLNKQKTNYTSLSDNFEFAGVISCAGALMNFTGNPVYYSPPAPTLLFHGSNDRVVPYDKRKILRWAVVGSNALADHFEKNNYTYYFHSFENAKHNIAYKPMRKNVEDIKWFISNMIYEDYKISKRVIE